MFGCVAVVGDGNKKLMASPAKTRGRITVEKIDITHMIRAVVVSSLIFDNFDAIQTVRRKLGSFNCAEVDQQFNSTLNSCQSFTKRLSGFAYL